MTHEERAQLIETYANGPTVVAEALSDFPADQLTAHPVPGKWSAAEIVHHLADSESTAAGRIRQLLTEDDAVIRGYDQEQYARALLYEARDIVPALDTLRAVRANTAQILRLMTDAQWRRAGTHAESGPYSAEKWLATYAAHAHKHAAQIVRLKEALVAAG